MGYYDALATDDLNGRTGAGERYADGFGFEESEVSPRRGLLVRSYGTVA